MKTLLLLLLFIPSLASAFNLNLGNETLDINAEYKTGTLNGKTDTSKAELSASYDPSISANWSFWAYNRLSRDWEAGTGYEDFAGGGIKYKANDSLSISYGPIGHYVDQQWDWLHSLRLKREGNIYCTAFYQRDFRLGNRYLTQGIVGFKLGKYSPDWLPKWFKDFGIFHKRERRESYRRTYNGIGFKAKIGVNNESN